MTFTAVGIDNEKYEIMAQQVVAHSTIAENAYVPLTVEDVAAIYQACLTESSFA